MLSPFNLQAWINEHRDVLKPPVGNKQLFHYGDFIVMVVGGPNSRNDYHYNVGSEFFYQIEGSIQLNIQEEGEKKTITIQEGEVFLLPPKVPHMPVRGANTVGLVIEHKRKEGEQDGLLWYCPSCNGKLYETFFPLTSIEKDFLPVFKTFNTSTNLRTCKACGTITPADTRFI